MEDEGHGEKTVVERLIHPDHQHQGHAEARGVARRIDLQELTTTREGLPLPVRHVKESLQGPGLTVQVWLEHPTFHLVLPDEVFDQPADLTDSDIEACLYLHLV